MAWKLPLLAWTENFGSVYRQKKDTIMRALAVKLILVATLLGIGWESECGAAIPVMGGASVQLAWTASPDPSVAGYYVVWGLTTGDYTSTNSYPATQTSVTVSGLETNATYYFNLAAFNSAGVASPYAGEVSFTTGTASGSTNATTTNTPTTNSLTVFLASTNGPPSPTGSGTAPATTSGNGGNIGTSTSISSSTSTSSAARFWGVPPFVLLTTSNGLPNLNVAGIVGANMMVQSTTNIFSPDAWETMTNITMTNLAPVAQSNQQAQPQDALDVAFVPSAESLPITPSNSMPMEYFRAVMPYDYVILAGSVLTGQGYKPRLIVVNMPGVIWDDACYVTEGSSFIHYDRANYALQLQGAGPTIRSIATTLANSLSLDWTSASEFTYSNGIGQIVATVIETEPPSSDPLPGKAPPRKSAAVIDF
jgi:hypothetical protein